MPPQLLGLPAISPELKPITPYLQRAEELRSQDPIIAYWCAYYAAQVGISLKARDNISRDVLFALLGVLERMKEEIGPSDAVDIEAASAAYVENFALKVFTMADNEDRSGRATRSTAKKFLAAANFLEVLKTFPKTDIQESNEEKIRYAKWKAADIAKAFREGRKPAPGPAGSEMEPDQLTALPPALPNANSSTTTLVAGSPPKDGFKLSSSPPTTHNISSSPSSHEIPYSAQHTLPPHLQTHSVNIDASSSRKDVHVEVDGHLSIGDNEGSMDNWSTVATPGTGAGTTPITDASNPHEESYAVDQNKPVGDLGQPDVISSSGSTPVDNARPRGTSTNQQWEGPPNFSSPPKKVTFTPSVVGGSVAPTSPTTDLGSHLNSSSSTIPTTNTYPFSASSLPPSTHDSIYGPLSASPRTDAYVSPSPHQTSVHALPTHLPVAAPPPFELTPTIVTKAQKHCRFAISALDYEDPETARKELRAALNLLGG